MGDVDEPVTLRLVHHHPGRLRLRSTRFEAENESVRAVREALEALPGVISVSHTARSGSVLIAYEPGLVDPSVLIDVAMDASGAANFVDESEARPERDGPARSVIGVARAVNDALREVTGERVGLGAVVPVALASAAVYSAVTSKGPALPRWDTLLWWSYSVFVQWHRDEIAHEPVDPMEDAP